MGESDDADGDLPFHVPANSLGEICFRSLMMAPPDAALMIEAETERSVTISGFLVLSIKTAEAMKELGFERGDSVALVGKQGIDISAAATATLFLGGKFSPIDPNMKAYEIQQLMKIIEPKVIFSDAEISEVIAQVVTNLEGVAKVVLLFSDPEGEYPYTRFEEFIQREVNLSEFRPVPSEDTSQSIAIQAFSSGSTGLPKAVMLSDRAVVYQLLVLRCSTEKLESEDDSWLQISHFFWITGITIYLINVCSGKLRILVRNPTSMNVLKTIDKYKPTMTFMPPVLLEMILNDPELENFDVSTIKVLVCGGVGLSKATYEIFKKKWPNPDVIQQSYGSTELGGAITQILPGQDIMSVGSPMLGVRVKVVKSNGELCDPGEDGELCFKTRAMMNGYAKNEKATAECIDEDGWYHSGDTGCYKNGMIYIRGRIKELIKYEAFQISPAEIEDLIRTVPGVADVGVAGIKYNSYSYHPMALVVKLPDSNITEEDIVKCVNENLSDYKRLRGGVCFVEEIPRTTTGKIKRNVLQSLAEELYMGD